MMKLWIEKSCVNADGKTVQVEQAVRAKVTEMTDTINGKVRSRGTRAVNALRNAELRVLRGKRSGKVYKKPFSKATYRASAPGEPPARRTGNLRLHWNGQVKEERSDSRGVSIIAQLESQELYAGILEDGSPKTKMAPRPFVEKIKEEATPEIKKIYSEPYT
jgi:hypothetical protein